jgi:signal transduction histidine kinase
VTITTETSGDVVHVSVADTGRGISPELVERLFIPFDRLSAEASGIEGTGLGLALSKSLCEAMGATLSVSSSVGIGSIFTVTLPVAESRWSVPESINS